MNPAVLLIEDDQSLNYIISHVLKKNKYNVRSYTDGVLGKKELFQSNFDIAVLDVNLGSINGFEILKAIKKKTPGRPVIMITAYGNINDAVRAIKEGAYDYLIKPFKEIELVHHIKNALTSVRLEKENLNLKTELYNYQLQDKIVGQSKVVQKLKKMISDVARSDVNVFISGETGTGKELVAKAIHRKSKRSMESFVAFNCAAISEGLLESELFGHKKGSFTGAIKDKKGKFEIADKGTVFLDEITEMPVHLQAKLLRAIQEQEIEPVGSNRKIKLNIRFIAATNKNIEKEIREKRFREDLFYRLNIFPLEVKPLRDRKEDIPLLYEHFLNKYNYRNIKLSTGVIKILKKYNWPGNIRELENIFHYAVVNADKIIESKNLPDKILKPVELKFNLTSSRRSLDDYMREILRHSLKVNDNNQSRTAKDLGITRAVLLYKMKKLGL